MLLELALELPLTHGKNVWLEFYLAHQLDWRLVLEKDIWLDYHWDFHFDPHLTIQILELFCLARFWARLLNCGLVLTCSGG